MLSEFAILILALSSSESVSQYGPGLIPALCHMWHGLSVLLVLALLPGFFSEFSGFPPSTLQFDLEIVGKDPLLGTCHCHFLFGLLYVIASND